MDTSVLLTIIGLIVGIVGTLYTIRSRNILRVIFLQVSVIPLFNSIVKNLTTISITHNGVPIDERLIHFRGSIINSGNKDIDESMMYSPLVVKLRDGFEWLEVTMEGDNSLIKSSNEILNKSELAFRWDLLKVDEQICFSALVATPVSKDSVTSFDIRFSHRIFNLAKVTYLKTFDAKQKMHGYMIFGIALFMIGLGYLMYPFQEYEFTDTIVLNGTRIPVTTSYSNPNMRSVISRDSTFNKEVSLEELGKTYQFVQIDKWYNGEPDYFAISIISLLSILWIIIISVYISQTRIEKLLRRVQI